MEGLDIRYTFVTDGSSLRQWLYQPDVLKWFPVSTEKEIDDAIQCWMGYCRYSCSLTATINNVPCGIGTLFLMPYRKVAHQAVFKVVVDPKWQKKGIGESLIRNLKHLAKNYFRLDLIGIEMFEGNPILSLLKKQGFQEIYRQDNYLKDGLRNLARIYMEVEL
jgi:ribosomal protein S18 acetylase RimI-like enzyme